MLNQNFAVLAALISLVGNASYAWDTLKGATQPNRVSWTLWMLAPLVAFAAELAEKADLKVALLTLAIGTGPLLVLIASSLNRQSYWEATRLDIACAAVSLLALILWGVSRSGNTAIIFSILADLFAATPTILKAYRHPESESVSTFIGSLIGGLITLFTIKRWTFATYAFPAYILIVETSIVFLLIASRSKQRVSSVVSSSADFGL